MLDNAAQLVFEDKGLKHKTTIFHNMPSDQDSELSILEATKQDRSNNQTKVSARNEPKEASDLKTQLASELKAQLARKKTALGRNITSLNSKTSLNSQNVAPTFYQEMTCKEFIKELMSDSDLSRIPFSIFEKMKKEPKVEETLSAELRIHLASKYKREYNQDEIASLINFLDKTLFIAFRDNTITLAQLKARVAELRGFGKYKVLDDIYPGLSNEEREKLTKRTDMIKFLFGENPKPEDYSRDLQPWEANQRCLRSIKFHYKKGVAARMREYS